jgi:hypothetical protein
MKTFSSVPRTVDEAVEQVLSGWSREETNSFRSLKPEDLFDLRNTLGADIRNTFSLWYGNDDLLNDCDRYLTENYEAYHQSFQLKIGKDNLDEPIDNDFFMDVNNDEDLNEEEEESSDLMDPLSIDMFPKQALTKDSDTPIDPFIAAQVIIFAVWKHLQGPVPAL